MHRLKSATRSAFLFAALSIMMTPTARAAIVAVDLGIGAPPATLGGYAMTQWTLPEIWGYASVPGAVDTVGGDFLLFSAGAAGICIQCGDWSTWSHGYSGSGYYIQETSTLMTLGSPEDAFLFYAEPNPFDEFAMTAMAQDGTTLTLGVLGTAGARGFGFYGTDGSKITSVLFSGPVDFAISEIATPSGVPEPGTLTLAGLGLAVLGLLRARNRA